jgi:hypothetical protein
MKDKHPPQKLVSIGKSVVAVLSVAQETADPSSVSKMLKPPLIPPAAAPLMELKSRP